MRTCPTCSRGYDESVEFCPQDGSRLLAAGPAPGDIVDSKYRVGELLGRGGLGAVYRANHVHLGRDVALKVILGAFAGDPSIVERFKREARTLARLDHPSIVAVHDFGILPDTGVYLVMELLEGRSLGDELRQRGALDVDTALDVLGQACAGVQAAHEAGVVHRDLKPDNIFLVAGNGRATVKVLDFGIAKAAAEPETDTERLTMAGAVLGTPAYMSPEQCMGEELDARSDVYSLGCVLYEMLTGRPPFLGTTARSMLYQHVAGAIVPPSRLVKAIPRELDAAILRALAKRPEERYQTAIDLARAAGSFLAETMVGPPRAPTRPLAQPAGLPQQAASFVGRTEALDEVARAVDGARLVTLVGPGGIGKTRLAVEAATSLAARFDDGVRLAELGALADPALVPQAVATALGVREEPDRSLTAVLAEYLGRRRCLLVLDNCEHLVDACAALAESLVGSCPELRVIATSREPLNIPGEVVWPVPPLTVSDPLKLQTAASVLASEAGRLFVDRATQSNPHFELTDEIAPSVASLCARLDGIPLALELAAGCTRALSVEQILSKLDDRFRLLTSGRRTALPRQQTLRAAMDWSYELLAADERALFERLSVFAGGFTLDAAEAICSAECSVLSTELKNVPTTQHSALSTQHSALSTQHSTLDLLLRLVDKSLVTAEHRGGDAVRYRMLETVREYAGEKLRASGDEADVLGRHRDWFLAYAEAATRGARAQGRLEVEHDNIRAALQWSIHESDDLAASLRLSYALGQVWAARGQSSVGHQWLEELRAKRDLSPERRANALYWAGAIALARGDVERASALLDDGLALRDELAAGSGAALAAQVLGRVAERLGDTERAESLHRESLDAYATLGDETGVARARFGLGTAALHRGDAEEAVRHLAESLETIERAGDRQGMALVLCSLGEAERRAGRLDRSAARYAAARELASETGHEELRALAAERLSAIEAERGDLGRAKALGQEALVIYRETEDAVGTACALGELASVALASGDAGRATRIAAGAARLREQLASPATAPEFVALDEALARVRAAVGSGALAAQVGSLDEIVAVALDVPPDGDV